MDQKPDNASMAHIPDSEILEEAAARLQTKHFRGSGEKLLYGSFRFIFHDGRFQGVEDWPRKKSYLSPERFAGTRQSKEARDGSND